MKKIGSVLVIVVVAGAMYVGINSIDADPPDVSAFTTTSEIPADEDNAWCGFVAATNAVKRSVDPLAWDKLSPDEIDALVAENADALAIFHDATLRTKWYDPTARREGAFCLFPVGDFARMIRLYNAKAERNIARGEIGTAVDGVRDFLALNRTMHADAESLVCWLVADGAHGMAMKLAAQVVASGKASDEELRALFGTLLLTDASTLRKSVQQAINNEFVYVFGDAQRIIRLGTPKLLPCEWEKMMLTRFSYHPNRTTALYVKMAGKAKELLSCDYDRGAWDSFDSEIETAKASVERYKAQLNDVKNNREYDTLSKEIEFQSLEIELCNKKIKEAQVRIEEKKEELTKNQEVIQDRQQALELKKSELDEIMDETRAEEDKLKAKVKELEAKIEPRLLTSFKRIRKNARNGLGIVYV